MRGYTYKYVTDPGRGTIKLKPTPGSYLKALAPWAIMSLVGWAVVASLPETPVDVLDELNNATEETSTEE